MTEEKALYEADHKKPFDYTEDLKLLAVFRHIESDAMQKLKDMRKVFEESPEYQAQKLRQIEAQKHSGDIEKIIKDNAIQDYLSTQNKHPHDKIGIRSVTRLIYAIPRALEWCKDNLPAAIKLDDSLFEKHARAVADTAPLDFVEIEKQPQATIATDLSEYLPPEDTTPVEIDFDQVEPVPF